MESHLIGFGKIDPLGNSKIATPKAEAKVKTSTNADVPIDTISLLTQKNIEMMQSQNTMLQKIDTIEKERSQSTLPPKTQQLRTFRTNPKWNEVKTQIETNVPNPLDPTIVVQQESSPWFLICSEPHDNQDCPCRSLMIQEEDRDNELVNTMDDID